MIAKQLLNLELRFIYCRGVSRLMGIFKNKKSIILPLKHLSTDLRIRNAKLSTLKLQELHLK